MVNSKNISKIFVALLRGINVGGRNKIEMSLLKKSFEDVGMKSVVTYINTGNIIFINNKYDYNVIGSVLAKAILKDFNLPIKVLIRDFIEYRKMIKALPDNWQNNNEMKSDVFFLWDEINSPSIVKDIEINPAIDTVKYISGSLLWKLDRKLLTKSAIMKFATTKLYQQVTIRNINTTRKIFEIMQKLEK